MRVAIRHTMAVASMGLWTLALLAPSVHAQDRPMPAVIDAGRTDAGRIDGGSVDAGRIDGGSVDAGAADAARVDGGALDAGAAVDGGGAGAITAPAEPTPEATAPLPEGHEPQLELSVTPEEGLMTGDLVHVIITASVPEGDDVAVPRQTFGPFELFDQDHSDRPVEGGRREFVFEVDLLALEPGEHELPALRIRVVTADGAVGFAHTEPVTIVVGSLVANEPDAQPRPPTEPVAVMQDDYTLAWVLGILGALLLTALITWLVARWWARRPKALPPPPPPRPAWEIALEKLHELRREQAELLAEGHHVDFVDGVSDALREYFGSRYGFNGLESTTDEVVSRLRDVRLQGVAISEVKALLGDCDLVKFAKAVPDETECDRMMTSAIRIVDGTTPRAGAISDVARPTGYTAAEMRVAQPGSESSRAPDTTSAAAPPDDVGADPASTPPQDGTEAAGPDATATPPGIEATATEVPATEATATEVTAAVTDAEATSAVGSMPAPTLPVETQDPQPLETEAAQAPQTATGALPPSQSEGRHPTLGGNPFDPEDRS